MKLEKAKFWADTITDLLGGHRVIFIDAREWQDWKPDTDIATLKDARAFEYDHKPGEGFFHIGSSYGVHDGLDSINIDPQDRSISMYSKDAAGGQAIWRVIQDLDEGDANTWHAWLDAQEAAWKIGVPV